MAVLVRIHLFAITCACIILPGCYHIDVVPLPAPPRPGWELTWRDEFSQRDGSAADPSRWKFATGGNGWGNQELEYYTSRPQNARIRHDNLEIVARKEGYTGADGVKRWPRACSRSWHNSRARLFRREGNRRSLFLNIRAVCR